VKPAGHLAVHSAVLYQGEGWVRQIPAVDKLTQSPETVYPYVFETVPIGSLSKNAPHQAVVIKAENPQDFGAVYLFLGQGPVGDRQVIALQQGSVDGRWTLPGGAPTDRVVGLIISRKPFSDPLADVKRDLRLILEAP
jgi:hypothetical protein